MGFLKIVTPNKFLCHFSLSTGALCSAIVLFCVTFICGIALTVQVFLMKICITCSGYAWRNAYSFSVCGVIYCIIMLAVHGWLIWGLRYKKTTVLISWVVVTSMWLSQTFFLLIILLCIHSAKVNAVAYILAFTFGMISICILLYLVLVVLGLWLELKNAQKSKTLAI